MPIATVGQVLTPVQILSEWTTAAGQLLPAFYTAAFDGAIDDLKDAVGLTAAWRAQQRRSTVALEARLRFWGLAWRAEHLVVESRIVDFDLKRLRVGLCSVARRCSPPAKVWRSVSIWKRAARAFLTTP